MPVETAGKVSRSSILSHLAKSPTDLIFHRQSLARYIDLIMEIVGEVYLRIFRLLSHGKLARICQLKTSRSKPRKRTKFE